jgi:hypothetical protein
MKKLKGLELEYEDGTRQRINPDDLDINLQYRLTELGLCSAPPEISRSKHYLIMEWRNGWRETVAVNHDAASLIRYFVIHRLEDRGRLSLDVGDENPELMIIERLPSQLSRLLIVGDGGVKAYELGSELEVYEGIFEAGGKKEYWKYDRENPHFQKAYSESPEGIKDIENAVAGALKEKGLSPAGLLAAAPDKRREAYRDIAVEAGIRGMKRQSDVYGLVEMLLRRLSGSSA